MQNVSIDVLEGKLIIMPFAFLINSFSALPDVIHKRATNDDGSVTKNK